MRFCPWYPLTEAPRRAPPAPSVLQVRIATGLLTYPRGRSAMIHYQYAANARAAATELASRWTTRDLWCRHLIEIDAPSADHLAGVCAKLLSDFMRRFGATPSYPDEAH